MFLGLVFFKTANHTKTQKNHLMRLSPMKMVSFRALDKPSGVTVQVDKPFYFRGYLVQRMTPNSRGFIYQTPGGLFHRKAGFF